MQHEMPDRVLCWFFFFANYLNLLIQLMANAHLYAFFLVPLLLILEQCCQVSNEDLK